MTAILRIEDEWHDDTPVARMAGEIDASNTRELGDHVRSLVTNHSFALVVDLSATTYVDSAGINLLFALGEELRARQQRLAIVVVDGSPIARMISLTGLDQAVATRQTLGEALAAVRG